MIYDEEPRANADTAVAIQALREVPMPRYDQDEGLERYRAAVAAESPAASMTLATGAKAFFGMAALAASVTFAVIHFGRQDEQANPGVSPTSATMDETTENLPKVETPSADANAREIRELADAESLLAASPDRALALARDSDARFSPGRLQQDRRFVIVRALLALDQREEAQREAVRFYSQDKDPAFRARIEAVLLERSANP